MGKITVKHYLNKELSPFQKENQWVYPIYVQVITLRKNLRFKSNNVFFTHLSDNDIKRPEILSLLEEEKRIIEYVVSDLINKGQEKDITSKKLNLYCQILDDVIEDNFHKLLKLELEDFGIYVPQLFVHATYSDIMEIADFFKEGNFLSEQNDNLRVCISAIKAIKDEISSGMGLYYIYDLFGGPKYESIRRLISRTTHHDDKITDVMIKSLQSLVIL